MSVTDDLQEKIEETRGDLAKLRKKLDEIEQLEQTLRAANDGLAQAGYNVSELAGIARMTQESLGATLVALEEVTQIVLRLEPDAILSAIQATDTSIKSEVKDVSNELTNSVSKHSQNLLESINTSHETTQSRIIDVSNVLTNSVSDHSQNLLESINATHETTQARIREEGARLSEQQSKVVKLFTWMGAFTLLGVSALIVLAILSFIGV